MSCLIALTHTPYGSQGAKESLDVALVFAAFEQIPAILFLDEGVLQLLPRDHSPTSFKHVGKVLKAFEMYDIEELWVEKESLEKFGVTQDDLNHKVNVIKRDEVASFCRKFNQHLVV